MPRPPDEQIFRRDGFRCVYCDFDGKTFEGWVFLAVDHFKPKSRGGSDEPDNLVTACVSCNHMKGAFEFSSLDAARAEVGKWRNQMRRIWNDHLGPST